MRRAPQATYTQVSAQKTRALSAFVAITSAANPPKGSVRRQLILAGIVLSIGSRFVLYELRTPSLLLGLAALFVGLTDLFVLPPGLMTFASAAERREEMRRFLLARLDRARKSIGLDKELEPEVAEVLEIAARDWERIGNSLASKTWRNETELASHIDTTAAELMSDVLAMTLGSAQAEGVSRNEMPEIAADRRRKLRELVDALERAQTALESYSRPSELVAGVQGDHGFPAFEELRRRIGLIAGDSATGPLFPKVDGAGIAPPSL